MNVIKEYFREILISLLFGLAGIFLVLLFPGEGRIRIAIELIGFIIPFILTLIISIQLKIWTIVDKSKNDIDIIYTATRMVEEIPKPVHNVMIKFSRRFFGDLCVDRQPVYISNYLELLEESLEEANESFLATSLITPSTWLNDKKYMDYFMLQAFKKDTYRKMNFERIFILKKHEFLNDVRLDDLVKIHWDAEIKLSFCDKEEIEEKDYRDLVMFTANGHSWVLDAGTIPLDISSEDKKTIIFMQFQCTKNYLQNQFKHWRDKISRHTKNIESKKVLEAMRLET